MTQFHASVAAHAFIPVFSTIVNLGSVLESVASASFGRPLEPTSPACRIVLAISGTYACGHMSQVDVDSIKRKIHGQKNETARVQEMGRLTLIVGMK